VLNSRSILDMFKYIWVCGTIAQLKASRLIKSDDLGSSIIWIEIFNNFIAEIASNPDNYETHVPKEVAKQLKIYLDKWSRTPI
jgi:hypothetical protein